MATLETQYWNFLEKNPKSTLTFEEWKQKWADDIRPIIEELNNLNGVLNVLGIRIFAKVGGSYSINESNQPYKDSVTKEIDITDFTLYGEPNSLYELKFLKDVSIRVKN